MDKCSLLHVGCGSEPLPEYMSGFAETRLDINPDTKPDIVASMLDLGDIGPFDAIFCSHALEHLFPHQVETAIREFYRVLKPGGYALVFVPDLEGVKLSDDVLFMAPSGPITGRDLIYGHTGYLRGGNEYMAHRTGFTSHMLKKAFMIEGFDTVQVRRLEPFNLMAVALK